MTTVLAVGIFAVAYVLIATERIHRVAAALAGAAGMVVIGVVDAHGAFFDEGTGVDWNVVFLLLGMMVIVGVVQQTGAFEYIAIWAAKRTRGRPFPTLAALVCFTALASALLDNVTTVLLVAPVTLLLCERLGLSPVPFLVAEVMASNIGGTATLIGDPPNIIIGSRADLGFNEFVVALGPIVIVLIGVLLLLLRVLFRGALHYDAERVAALMALEEREVLRDRALLLRCGIVLLVVVVSFVAHPLVGLDPSLVALLGAGALVAVSGLEPAQYLAEVEWATLVFFMGLFVMVGGLVETGVIGDVGDALTSTVAGHQLAATSGLLVGSGVLSGVVDNIPYVATVTPLVHDLTAAGGGRPLWWALALGADLGGNATAVGASANVVVLGIAARSGHPISFWRFTRYGLLVAPVTIAVSWVYLWLRYYALG